MQISPSFARQSDFLTVDGVPARLCRNRSSSSTPSINPARLQLTTPRQTTDRGPLSKRKISNASAIGCKSARGLSASKPLFFDFVRPLCVEIGIAWQRNEIGIFEEQLLSEQIADSLRKLIARTAIERIQPSTSASTVKYVNRDFYFCICL